MKKMESDKLRERCVNSFITWYIKSWQNWLKSCYDSEIMHKNQIYANKKVLKYPFPIYLKLNYMLQFLIVLISILISLLKPFFWWICHYGCTMKQLWWIFHQVTKVTSFHLNRFGHAVRTISKTDVWPIITCSYWTTWQKWWNSHSGNKEPVRKPCLSVPKEDSLGLSFRKCRALMWITKGMLPQPENSEWSLP